MKKIKILLAVAFGVIAVTSCGANNTNGKVPSNINGTNIGNDMRDMGDAASDAVGNAMNNVKNAAGNAANNVKNAAEDLTGMNGR